MNVILNSLHKLTAKLLMVSPIKLSNIVFSISQKSQQIKKQTVTKRKQYTTMSVFLNLVTVLVLLMVLELIFDKIKTMVNYITIILFVIKTK